MQHGNYNDATLRNGDWGPAYCIEGPTSDIGVLVLRPGDSMTNHIHEHCDESFIVIEGTATLWVGAIKQHQLVDGDVYRCGPGEMHYFINESDSRFRCIFIKSPASPGDTITLPWTPGQAIPALAN